MFSHALLRKWGRFPRRLSVRMVCLFVKAAMSFGNIIIISTYLGYFS